MSFLPYLIFAEVICGVINGIITFDNTENFSKACQTAWDSFKNILCLSMLNFYIGDITWYISSLMISTAILYPILRRSKVIFPRFIAPVIGVVLIIMILVETGAINAPNHITYGFVKKGLLRGIAEMCLGIFAYELVNITRKFTFPKEEIVFGVIEIVCYLTVLICIFSVNLGKVDREIFEFVMIALLFIAVSVTMSNRSITYQWVQKWEWACENSGYIALASLLIYLNHPYLIDLWDHWGPSGPAGEEIFVIFMVLVMSLACFYAGKYIRKFIIDELKKGLHE